PTMTAETPLISVRDLSVRYGNRNALDGLDLELSGSRIVGLLGENGCGKSTLLKVLAGVYADHTGDVRLAGHRLGPESKALVSYLPDTSSLPDSVRVSYCLGLFEDFFADFDRAKAAGLIDFFGLERQLRLKGMYYGRRAMVMILLG